jgi:diguanylate cyclase (GGDEF)-like protein
MTHPRKSARKDASGEEEIPRAGLDAERPAADVDQASSGRDQAGPSSDRALSDVDQGEQAAIVRAESEQDRFAAADQRDQAARARDQANAARDRAAAARDVLAERHDSGPLAATARKGAADDRRRAADDRHRAADDREQARIDREEFRAALTDAHFDDLTGTYRRAQGIIAVRAEIDRAHRSHGRLVLAFVDVDGLKAYNDRDGHAAGDQLLLAVVDSIRSNVRSYDPIVRFGGDEFICALADTSLDDARVRFDQIHATLNQTPQRGTISVGFAELLPDDTVDTLIARGDMALYAAKQQT